VQNKSYMTTERQQPSIKHLSPETDKRKIGLKTI
jgi:hypothetical protein